MRSPMDHQNYKMFEDLYLPSTVVALSKKEGRIQISYIFGEIKKQYYSFEGVCTWYRISEFLS